VDYDWTRARLRIAPRLPRELIGKEISLSRLIIPTGNDTRLSLRVKQTALGKAEIAVEIRGALPKVEMEVLLPKDGTRLTQVTDGEGRKLPIVKEAEALPNVIGVRMPARDSVALRFE
jgi:hypothetical protein